MERHSKNSHLSNSSMLFTDPIQSKQFSLFDPYKDTIQPDDNEREISTANKSEFGVLKYSQKEQQDRQCKNCRYNLSDESYFGELPCQMMPVSDQQQINGQEQGSHDEEQGRGSRKRSNIGPRQRRKRRRADAEPQAGVQGEQNYIIRRGGKMVGKYLQKISEASEYKCNKKKCEQNSSQYFRGNIGCNTNCECMNCANLAYCSSQKKAQKPINLRENLKKKDKSQKLKGSCQCKKTNCIKNYCQCYHGGKSCGEFCSCIGCQNQQP